MVAWRRGRLHGDDRGLDLGSWTHSLQTIESYGMEVIMGMIMFGILWRLRDHKHAEGWLFGVWCVLAGIERFIVEFFRAKDDRLSWTMGLSLAQVIAVGMVAIGAALMAWRSRTGPGRPGIRGVAVAA